MESLVEKYMSYLRGFTGSLEEYRAILVRMCREAQIIGIDGNIKFFARRHHNRMLSQKAEEDNAVKTMLGELDDLIDGNFKYWKQLDANYRYFYKDIAIR